MGADPDHKTRDAIVHRIAAELDMPSLYMGGPSAPSRRRAARIVDLLPELAEWDELRAENAALRGAIEAHRSVEYGELPGNVDPDFLIALAEIDAALYSTLAIEEAGDGR